MHHFGYSMNFNDIIHCEGGNKREGAEKRSSGEAENRRSGESRVMYPGIHIHSGIQGNH